MVPLKPITYSQFSCPECKSNEVQVQDNFFEGIHTLAECRCKICDFQFYHDYPVGNAKDQPTAIGIPNGKFYKMKDKEGWQWLPEHFERDAKLVNDEDLPIRKIVHKECKDVIILNTIDFCYGHIFSRLVNSQYYLTHEKDKGLILIIPKIFEWLVPEGCAEVWILDIGLGKFSQWLNGFNRYMQEELKRFDSVDMSPAYTNPEWKNLGPEAFTGVKPFDLTEFDTKPKTFTFVTREDRLWFKGPVHEFMHRAAKKFKLKWLEKYYVQAQNRRMRKTMKYIKAVIPDAKFKAIGIGTSGSFGPGIEDLREDRPNAEIEREWCRHYAESHVVMGVHGSNMHLPTWHAAGALDILPTDRLGNMVQDICVRYYDRRMLFFYRHLYEYVTPKYMAENAVSMVESYTQYELNMCQNVHIL